ncbi:MAG: DUF4149 domain-containing protein [Campylobacterales bacterium]|nr:DUF4149 domain-containing protein [Campylobacterales bacterium]
MKQTLFVVYMLSVGAMVGVELAVGLMMAPVIFNPSLFLGEGVLSHYQSGILMTQVFLRFNMALLIVTLFGALYEVVAFKQGRGDKWAFGATVIVVYAAMMFIFYYTPFIVEAQAVGPEATQTDVFASMHKGSEWMVKVLLMAQVVVFGRRIWVKK